MAATTGAFAMSASVEEHRLRYDLLWKEFFKDPSQWWDNRASKKSPLHADFKHKVTRDALSMDGFYNRSWVLEELRSRGFLSFESDLGHRNNPCASGTTFPDDKAAAFVVSLRACSKSKDLSRGTRLHKDIRKMGLLEHCSDALITMYAKCGEMAAAKELLDTHKSWDVITWTAIIAGYARKGQSRDALHCFKRMQLEGVSPNSVTYTCALKACATIGAASEGEEIHREVVRQGLLQDNIVVGNALVDMYAKCGVLSQAQDVLERLPFRDVISWNALIGGYVQEGKGEQALNCLERMKHEGISPDAVTYIGILKACAVIGAFDRGKKIHDEILKQGWLQENMALGTAVVDMYAKCGSHSRAQDVLEKLPRQNVISWNALIAGYVQHGHGKQALNCLKCMEHVGICPDAVTYLSILKACATIGAVRKGEEIHRKILKGGLLRDNMMLGNALVDMYAKCGALSKAQDVLEKLPSRNVVTWSTLITGYAQEGQGEQALNCFEWMQQEGILPDAVTLVCVLNACSHLGLIEKGYELFQNMSSKYGLVPNLECYTCMIDLFGRTGQLEKAIQLIEEMPSSERSAIWLALLGACKIRRDVNVGRWAFEQAVQVDKRHGPPYILMADIYAAAGMQEEASGIRTLRVKNKAGKKPYTLCTNTLFN